MNEDSAYKSNHPAVLDGWAKLHADLDAWNEAAFGWAAEVGADGITRSADRLLGFPASDDGTIPQGWRRAGPLADGSYYVVPDRRTKTGKANDRRLRDMPPRPSVRDLVGMPDELWVPSGRRDGSYTIHYPAEVFDSDGYLWCRWRCDRSTVENPNPHPGFTSTVFDASMWTNVPLSEFYTVHERRSPAVK